MNGFVSAGGIANCFKNQSFHDELQVEEGLLHAVDSNFKMDEEALYCIAWNQVFPATPSTPNKENNTLLSKVK